MSLSLLELLAVLAIATSVAAWQLQAWGQADQYLAPKRCEHSIEAAQRYHAEHFWLEHQGAMYSC